MNSNRYAELAAFNLAIKRQVERARPTDGKNWFGRYAPLARPGERWSVWMKARLSKDGTAENHFDTEGCFDSAATTGDALWKLEARLKATPDPVVLLQDKVFKGLSLARAFEAVTGWDYARPPPQMVEEIKPQEWIDAERRAAGVAVQAGERMSEWNRKSAWGRMRHIGLDPVKFNAAWDRLAAMGLVSK